MHILFIHDAFPAQFGRVGLELTERYGWQCSYLVRSFTRCPEPSQKMLDSLTIQRYTFGTRPFGSDQTPWPQLYGEYVEQCAAVLNAAREWPDLRPDLIVANGGRGAPTLYLAEHFDCPIVTYCEYYFARSHRDLTYRIDLPPAEPAPFFPRVINAPTLASLTTSHAGCAPTHWQKQSFPERFHHKIEVHFDGVDEQLYAPGQRVSEIAGRTISPETKVVTFVARGMESMRGFDLFIAAASRIAQERSDVLFVVAGDEKAYYGWDSFHAQGKTFQEWTMSRIPCDPSRFLFLGHVSPETLADVLRRSDLHLYLSVPFVTSWSLFNAMSTGAVVLASDIAPVREIVKHEQNGLLCPLFDTDQMANLALDVLATPAKYAPLGRAARDTILSKYSLDACMPNLKDYYERVANL